MKRVNEHSAMDDAVPDVDADADVRPLDILEDAAFGLPRPSRALTALTTSALALPERNLNARWTAKSRRGAEALAIKELAEDNGPSR